MNTMYSCVEYYRYMLRFCFSEGRGAQQKFYIGERGDAAVNCIYVNELRYLLDLHLY